MSIVGKILVHSRVSVKTIGKFERDEHGRWVVNFFTWKREKLTSLLCTFYMDYVGNGPNDGSTVGISISMSNWGTGGSVVVVDGGLDV